MKALKLLIFGLLFVAGQQAFGQNIIVNNHNMTITMNVTFNFLAPCAPVATSTPPMSSTVTPYGPPAPCPIKDITITFVDNSCSPPATINVTVPYGTGPIYMYTMCNGMMVNFDLQFNGVDYILEIID